MPKAKRAGKVKDKWREKKWITVLSSPGFQRAQVAYVPITSNENAMGRIVETTLFDITKQDPQQNMLIKLHFQITNIEGNIATTVLKGEEYAREYLRSLVRRGASMVNFIRDYATKDGAVARVYVVAFTIGRINSSRKHEIRLAADTILKEKAQAMFYEQFAQEAIKQNISREIYDSCKDVAKIRHLGIRKIKLIKAGESMPSFVSEAKAVEEEEEGEEALEDLSLEAGEAEKETPAVAAA